MIYIDGIKIKNKEFNKSMMKKYIKYLFLD